MPEGDTIHRIARVLGRELPGRTVDRLALHDLGDVPQLKGRTVQTVEAHGKHLLIHIEGDWTVRVHLGMKGRWNRMHAREKLPRTPTILLVTGDVAYVCNRAYRAELVRTRTLRTHPRLARLGPDLLADPPDIDAAVSRALLPAHAGRDVADLLLDQRVASGIGNVYKSEVLFQRKLHPRTLVRTLDEAAMRALFTEAARLMRLNLTTRARTAVPIEGRPQAGSALLYVYGRGGKPCLECRTPIRRFLQGDMARSTYFCPNCQPGAETETNPEA